MACRLFGARPLSETIQDDVKLTFGNIKYMKQNKAIGTQENEFENLSAEGRPFSCGLGLLK